MSGSGKGAERPFPTATSSAPGTGYCGCTDAPHPQRGSVPARKIWTVTRWGRNAMGLPRRASSRRQKKKQPAVNCRPLQSPAPSTRSHGAPNQTGRKGSGDPGQLHGNLQEVRHPSLAIPDTPATGCQPSPAKISTPCFHPAKFFLNQPDCQNRLKTTTPGFPPRGRLRDSPLMGTTSCHTHQTTNPCREPNGPPADICALINHFLIRADDFRQNSQSKIWQKPFFSTGITPEFANY